MTREIVVDTETTGLEPLDGHRLVEIGAIELINHVPSGRFFHCYLNPDRPVPPEAFAVHGLSDQFLADKPRFPDVADQLLEFFADSPLVIHNAAFDCKFLNAEFGLVDRPVNLENKIIDTLALARQRHPMGPNSLDALCRRYGIDNSKRIRHGALLDAELLADVYLELIGGRQTALAFVEAARAEHRIVIETRPVGSRPNSLLVRITDDERDRHRTMVNSLGPANLWASYEAD